MKLSVVLITHNEEQNLARTLESVKPLVAGGHGEIIVVDSGSTDRTVEIAKSYGAKIFVEEWKGFAAQKNSALDKAAGDWILSLDADEEVSSELASEIVFVFMTPPSAPTDDATIEHLRAIRYIFTRQTHRETRALAKAKGVSSESFFAPLTGFWIPRKNHFLGRWIRHGGYWPDPKLRLFRRGSARFEDRLVHEDVKLAGPTGRLRGALVHHSYPTVSDYIEHMNRYSSLGAQMVVAKGPVYFTAINLTLRPVLTFFYNYIFRLGFLDGKEGFLLHVNHSIYVAWKYAKAWEFSQTKNQKP